MKFYVLFDGDDSPRNCETTLRKAKQAALRLMDGEYGEDCMSIKQVEVPVNADSIRRLLGDLGGYAKDMKLVWQSTGSR